MSAIPGTAALAQRAWDELAIMRVVGDLARAEDDRDFQAYRACYADEILLDQPLIAGWVPQRLSADAWTETVRDALSPFDATQHRLFNHAVDVEGDDARCAVDVSALHQRGRGPSARNWVVGGRYFLRLRREGGRWLVTERALQVRYETGDTALRDIFPSAVETATGSRAP